MIINFNSKSTPINPTFGDVEDNQFFVDQYFNLCQKYDFETYTVIADGDGNPLSDLYKKVPSDRSIERILPKVEKINFL